MAFNFKTFWAGIKIKPKTTSTANSKGDLEVIDSTGKLGFHNGSTVSPVVTESHSATLTNKSIDASTNIISNIDTLDLAAGVLKTDVTMASALNTEIPSALAIKTYVDSQILTKDAASEISFTPVGSIIATDVQAMGAELDSDLTAHINDTIDAHDGSAISVVPVGNLVATDVQSAFAELDSDISNIGSDLGAHIVDAIDAHDASAISNVPSGNLAATEVQAALNELQSDVDTRATSTDLTTHINNTTGAHAASAISNTPSGNLAATQVQAALNELQSDIDTRLLATGGTFTSGSIVTPIRSDVKQDTLANLTTYALTAANGQIVYATDEKAMYQVVDTELVGIGGAGIVKLTAGENISALDLVYISTGTGNDSGRTAGRLYKVDASNDDRNEVLGFATKSVTSGNTGEAQVSGNLKGFTGLTPGKIYYASASVPGAITLTPPSTNGQWVVAVCLASKATEIVINPVSSASAIYVVDGDTSFTIANNQSSAANVTGLLFDGVSTRSFILDYSIYRKTDTALSALAQSGQLRGVYNTQSSTWLMSDDFSGQNSGVTFTVLSSGQLQYTSTNIAGANYVGTLKYAIRKTFGV